MNKPSVLVAPYPRTIDEVFDRVTLARLRELADVVWGTDDPVPDAALPQVLSGADAVVFGTWPADRDVLGMARDLKAMLEVSGRLPNEIDYEACFERGILVGSCAPAFGPAVAEMALALTLATIRGVVTSDRAFRTRHEAYLHAGTEGTTSLHGTTVGFIGCGGLARSLQPLLRPFDVDVVGYDPWLDDAAFARRQIERVDLAELFDRSDIAYVLAVPTPANAGLVSRRLMELLDPTDALIVISRAHLVDFAALTDLLRAGRFKAGIDVFPEEPLPPDHPIRDTDAVLTAHIAGAVPDALHDIGRMVVDDLASILQGTAPTRMQYATPQLVEMLRGSSH